jgi:hypothetical protein
MGVRVVEDLADVYTDLDMLEEIHSKANQLDFKKFLRACSTTAVLIDGKVALPEEMAALIQPHAFKQSRINMVSDEQIAHRRLVEVQKTLDALRAPKRKRDGMSATEIKISEMEVEILRIERRNALEKDKQERGLLFRQQETDKRQHLINGKHELPC